MKVFILTSKGKPTEVFKTLQEVENRIHELSVWYNDNYSLFGRPYDICEVTGNTIALPYMADSVAFRVKGSNSFASYIIECICTDTLKLVDLES